MPGTLVILTHLTLTATLWNRWLLFHFTSEELRHEAVKKFTPGVHGNGATAQLYTPATATELHCCGITLSFSSFHYALKHFINYSHLSLQTHLTLSLSPIYLVNLMAKPFYKFIHFIPMDMWVISSSSLKTRGMEMKWWGLAELLLKRKLD